jgi:hypothetical protein
MFGHLLAFDCTPATFAQYLSTSITDPGSMDPIRTPIAPPIIEATTSIFITI